MVLLAAVFSLGRLGEMLLPLAVAYALAALVGFERGKAARTAGFRTFPLVALGVAAYTLIGEHVLSGSDARSRLIQGVLTGIGFIGGGAILKTKGEVHGLATAASLWNAGCIGLAAAYGEYALATVLALANLLTLHLFRPAHHEPPQRD